MTAEQRLLTISLDIDSISSNRERSYFDEANLEKLARAIIGAGGIINPILVRELSPIKYEVIEGHFEYYAALKASEIDYKFAEIRAIVFPKDLQLDENIIIQINTLRKKEIPLPISTQITPPEVNKFYQASFNDLENLIKSLTLRLSVLESKIPDFSEIIVKMNDVLESKVAKPKQKTKPKKEIPNEPINITSATLDQLLSIRGISHTRAEAILSSRPDNLETLFSILRGASKEHKEAWQRSFIFEEN